MKLLGLIVGLCWTAAMAASPSESGQKESGDQIQHWSLRPVARPNLPRTHRQDWVRNGVDHFVLARLELDHLEPGADADPITLVRRLYFTLTGLPPSPDEIRQFLADRSGAAYPNLVERLLASPRYGECWTRHWLDVVRFAESNGFEMNLERTNAWPYRDYVIRAFNQDEPYDRFVAEQLAGDGLGTDEATGFLVGGPFDTVKSPDINLTAQQRMDELNDMVSTTGTTFLGLTVGCARCHNHKFDPISQTDYYSMQAIFAGVQHGERAVRTPDYEARRVTTLTAGPTAYLGRFEEPGPSYRLYRGEALQTREQVTPAALHGIGVKLEMPANTPEQQRRRALAAWITDASNPLAARVMVNRLWQHHFGQGLANTPSDFGKMGVPPTHPELLDWLASEFIACGWSVKHIQRLIVLSSTYRQSSAPATGAMKVDSSDRLLWRFAPRRLAAEAIRDSILSVSGNLNLRMGSRGFDLFEPNGNYVKVYNPKSKFGPEEWRRMVYQAKPRMRLDDTFGAFDCPDAGQATARRTSSITPLQAFNLLNSPFILQQSEIFAQRLVKEAGSEVAAQVQRAFDLAFSRLPDDSEREAAETLVRQHGLPALCRALFNANEFLYVF